MRKQNFFIFLLILFLALRIFFQGGLNPHQSDLNLKEDQTFSHLRQFLAQRGEKLLPQPQSGLLLGMVLGEKSSLPFEFNNALKNTSTIHMVVVSGQNLTMLAGFVMSLSFLLGRKKTLALSLFVVLFYVLLTGFAVPVLRAALMVLVISLASFFNKQPDSFRLLSIVALFMLIFQPNLIYSISFQLSFLATLGVSVLAPEMIKRVNFLPEIIKQDLIVSLAAQLTTLPIIAFNFYQISLIGIFANTLVLWTVPIIMITGAIAIIFSFIYLPLGYLLAFIPGIFLTYFVSIVNLFNQPFGVIKVGSLGIIFWIGYYLVLLGYYFYLKKLNQQDEAKGEIVL